jgi:tetratricopeptide (TPR) repeat protein
LSSELEAAMIACEQGSFEEALQLCQAVVSRDPTDAGAFHLIGVVYGMRGEHTRAAEQMLRAVQLAAHRVDYRRNLVRAYLQLGRAEDAQKVLREGLLDQPNSGQLWEMLGIVLAHEQQLEPAKEAYQRAIALAPEASSLHFGLSELYRRGGNVKQAIGELRIALQLDPNNVNALNNLAGLELFSGDFLEALRTIKRLLELAPHSAQAHFNLARLLEVAGDLEQAITALRNSLKFDSSLISARFLIASLQIQLGELDEAQRLVGELVETMGHDSPQCLTALAKIHERRGRLDEAQLTLDKIGPEFAAHPEVATTRAIVAEQQGRYQEAIDGLCKVLAEDRYAASEGIGIYFMLGQLYDVVGEYDQAFEAYRSGNENRKRAFVTIEGEVDLSVSAFEQLNRLYAREMYDACPTSGLDSEQPVFIVGMPRSGTTLVEQILASHSKVFGAGELALIQDGIASSYPQQARRSPLEIIPADQFNGEKYLVPYGWGSDRPVEMKSIAEGYLQQIQRLCPSAVRITDKLPYNFFLLPLIHRLFPRATILHVQRNALDTCLSCYFQNFTTGNRFSFDLKSLGRFYVDYKRLMHLWTVHLGVPVLNISYESLAADPEPVARQMIEYCGLDWEPNCLNFYRSARTVNTASYQQVRRPLYTSSIGRAKHYLHNLGPLIDIVKSVEPNCDIF